MAKVYFKPVSSYSNTEEVNKVSVELLNKLIENENIPLESFIPLKVTVGEKGNTTYIHPENFNGIIDYLESKKIECVFMETNVLYKGQRTTRENHLKLAKEHGFTRLPLIIADGDHGENYELVEISRKHFQKCKIGKEFADQKQLLVISHFKGHMLAGFGGAVKQLGMGCAARGGKLDQHANSIPKINPFKCKSCKACAVKCPESAIIMGRKASIDKNKCVGCASCMTVCPHGAITNSWFASISKSFNERLAEYAYAASKDKNNIYINFVFNITKGCDCEGHPMKLIAKDVGLLVSTDPISLDQACLDMLEKVNGKKLFTRGRYTLLYGEKIGLGTREYELVEI